jgi:uncharacterized protein YcbK (DUF882 family)
MNRRYFLGLALSAAATPVLAKKRNNQERILSFHHLHTEEKLRITYRIGDHYQRNALHKLNTFLRDFRTGDSAVMDPKLFDLLYDIKRGLGDDDGVFEIISAYRSPVTNTMLRRTSRGVARNSLHLRGQALDIRFSGMSTRRIRDSALSLRRGGVGFYPRSDFVHVDTGSVRRWGA